MTEDPRDDRRQRARALDPAESFIVQAPAGSGKTELLTQRCLALLAVVEAPEEVVALTFTRKAATEMRNRIVAALAQAANDPGTDADEPHKRLTRALGRAALETDRRHDWQLQRNPLRLRIMTIDALCAALARRMPVLSGFGAAPRILENAEPLYREAARLTIDEVESGERWSEAIACLLRHLDNHLANVEALITRMLARRDQWLRHAMNVDRDSLEKALAAVVRESLGSVRDAIPDDAVGELIEVARFAAENLARHGQPPAMAGDVGEGRLPGDTPEDVDAWRDIARLMLTDKGRWRARLTVREGFPAKGDGADRAQRERNQEMKQRIAALIARLEPERELRLRLFAVLELPPPRYGESQWEILAALTELLHVAAGILEVLFRERGQADFIRVAVAAQTALGGDERPTELALQMDRQIRHVLVDEFQDTSFGQYRLLESLTAGWQPEDGRTLFVVGDPMQSIYRFREAEVGLYLRARERGIGSVRLTPLQLTTNYRSQAGIVDWVNRAFARILPEHQDSTRGAVPYSAALASHPALQGDAVTVHPGVGSSHETEAATVTSLVRDAFAADPEASIAILVRNRAHLADIVPQLKAAGLRFRAVEIDPLAGRPVIRDLLSLACALTHPGDRLSWLAVLRAPWCGLTLDDLHVLVEGAPDRTVWELINDDRRGETLGNDGRRRLETLRAVMATSLAERRRRSLRRQVEGTWLALGGPACVERQSDLDDAAVLFELLDELGDGGDLVEREVLTARLEQLFARPDSDGDARLQIMTIHKAKGLEFDTVIVPGLGRRPRPPNPELLRWMERPQGDLLLAPIRESGADDDPIYRYLARLDRDKSLLEDERLLYVAATRAKRRLHWLGQVSARPGDQGLTISAPRSRSLLERLWPVVAEQYEAAASSAPDGGPPAAGPANADASRAPQPIVRLAADWRLPEAPAAVTPASAGSPPPAEERHPAPVEFLWAGETARAVGTVTHRLLQHCARRRISEFGDLDPERLRRSTAAGLMQLGVPAAALDGAAGRVIAALQSTFADPRGRWILDPRHEDARSELALTMADAGGAIRNVVIDRSFIDADGLRWIIDYKTGVHEGGGVDAFLDRERARYHEQLERYALLMRRRESRPIRVGLYFPLLRGWREWEPVSAPDTAACP